MVAVETAAVTMEEEEAVVVETAAAEVEEGKDEAERHLRHLEQSTMVVIA